MSLYNFTECGFKPVFHRLHHHLGRLCPLVRQLYTRGHHCAADAGTDLLASMSHYHVKRVKAWKQPFCFNCLCYSGELSAAHSTQIKPDGSAAPCLYETNLLRNGSELLAVMVRASWAIGEDTGFVLPSWSILVGSWFLRASSWGQQST